MITVFKNPQVLEHKPSTGKRTHGAQSTAQWLSACLACVGSWVQKIKFFLIL